MNAVRRAYVYLAAAISLQATTWALIPLLRTLLTGPSGTPVEAVAFRMAMVVVGLPLFLVHWRWAERLSRSDAEERWSAIRWVYLYGMMALFLLPLLANAFCLAADGTAALIGLTHSIATSPGEGLLRNLAAIVVLGALWLYHRAVAGREELAVGAPTAVRRLYTLFFAFLGSILAALGATQLLKWVAYQFGTDGFVNAGGGYLACRESARLLLGLAVWFVAWRRARRLAESGDAHERDSSVRLLYLYGSIFATVLVGVGSAALLLAGGLRLLLGLAASGDWRDVVPNAAVMAVGWFFFSAALEWETRLAPESGRRATIRRVYHYLVCGIALGALALGLGGVLQVLFRSLGGPAAGLPEALRERLAWSTAALVAGLAVWVLPWRRMQALALEPGVDGASERRSVVRKAYLYFYLFVATVVVLASGVYVLARLFTVALGGGGGSAVGADLTRALAYGLVGVALWLYHGSVLRHDGRLARQDSARHEASLATVILDPGDGTLGRAIREALRAELQALPLSAFALSGAGVAAIGDDVAEVREARPVASALSGADLVVGPWDLLLPVEAGGAVAGEAARELAASPARKLLLPRPIAGVEWAGVEAYTVAEQANQVVAAVRQILSGDAARPARRLSLGAVLMIAVGAILLFLIVVMPLLTFITGSSFEYLFG